MVRIANFKVQDKVYWSSLNGYRYLMIDFSGLEDYEILEVMLHVSQLIKKQEQLSLRIVIIVKDTCVGFSTHITLKKLAKELQSFVFKSAMVGIDGLYEPIYKMYSKFTNTKSVLFNTEQEGINYICS